MFVDETLTVVPIIIIVVVDVVTGITPVVVVVVVFFFFVKTTVIVTTITVMIKIPAIIPKIIHLLFLRTNGSLRKQMNLFFLIY